MKYCGCLALYCYLTQKCHHHCWPFPPSLHLSFKKSILVYSIITTRNQHLHQDAGSLSLPDYRQAVITMYELHQQLPPEVQEAVFHRPLEEMLDKPPAFLRSWIEHSQRYIQQQLKAAKKHAKLHTPDIHLFFRRQNPPANDLNPL